MGWDVYSDAVVRSSDVVLVFVVTASRYISDAVSSHCREILEQCWCSWLALDAAGMEAERLRNLIHEILIWPKPIAPISIRCDSAPTMARAYSQIYNGKSRHLGVRHSMDTDNKKKARKNKASTTKRARNEKTKKRTSLGHPSE
ncbi:hypothetical protein Tco_0255001 [Tanacetum coccineum]